jgi:sulfite exporter TauE/SafE
MTGFLLGLATGASCLALCAPVLVPYLVAEGQGTRRSVPLLGQFMLGRLVGYLLFGLVAGAVGSAFAAGAPRSIVFGVAYLALGVALLFYGFGRASRPATACALGGRTSVLRRVAARWPRTLPLVLGLLTGLNLCPPFALALTTAVDAGGVGASVWFFLTFFLGTSLFFLPLPGLGGLRRFERLRTIARLAAGVVGGYSLYRGLILFYGGLVGL